MYRCPSLLEQRELSLCEALLKLDQRNFHCWNHWMLICNMMNVSTEERLAFTMKRIEENPSNYSAWHFRCELISKTITETNAESVLKEGGSALLHSCVELDLNLNGLYTECDDQSAWYYLRSLVYLIVKFVKSGVLAKEKGVELISNELEALAELEEAAPDCIYLTDFKTEIEHLLHTIEWTVS